MVGGRPLSVGAARRPVIPPVDDPFVPQAGEGEIARRSINRGHPSISALELWFGKNNGTNGVVSEKFAGKTMGVPIFKKALPEGI